MKIEISAPGGPYSTSVDTGAMDVTLFKVFNGVTLITETGEKLDIAMRDSGFEVVYTRKHETDGQYYQENPTISFQGGVVQPI